MKFAMTASLCVAWVGLHATASAALRDPTEPPPVAQAAMAASSAGSGSAADDAAGNSPKPRHIIVSNGRSYLVERGRRLGVGDALGSARIERIDSDAVWLREGSSTRRVPLYAGVSKRPAIEYPSAPSPAPSPAASAAMAKRTARTHSPQKEAP